MTKENHAHYYGFGKLTHGRNSYDSPCIRVDGETVYLDTVLKKLVPKGFNGWALLEINIKQVDPPQEDMVPLVLPEPEPEEAEVVDATS